MKFKSC